VESVYAQIAPALEDVGGVQFEAVNGDDEPQAQRESAIVRAMLLEGHGSEGGFVSLTDAIKDALLMRTGVLALGVQRMETRTPEQWEDVGELGVGDVIAPNAPGQVVESVQITPQEGDDATDESGQALYSVSLTRVDVDKRLVMSAVARENFVCSSSEERDPERMRFCADRIVTTRARLVAEGFDKGEVQTLTRHDPTRYELFVQRAQEQTTGAMQSMQDATEMVEIWRCYPLLAEKAGDAAAQRFKVYYSRDAKIVLGEPQRVGRVCYAVGNVILYPHRLDGVSMFDRIGEIQEIKSKALRGWQENLHKVNRPRLGVDEQLANLADAKDSTQDIIRIKGANGLIPVPVVDAGPSVAAFLDYMDRARSERGGASLDMQSATAQVATNQTAQGIERQYSSKEQLAAMMARTFGETGLRGAFLAAHYLLRTQWGSGVDAKVAGEWVQDDPSKWRGRGGVVVRIGQSETQRRSKANALVQVIGMQAQAMQAGLGGILTDETRMFNAASDLVTANSLRNPERYFIDPASKGARQAKQGLAAQQRAMVVAQGDAAKAQLQLEKYKIDMESLTDLVGEIVRAAVEEAKLTLSAVPIQEAKQGATMAATSAATSAAATEPGGEPPHPQAQEFPEASAAGLLSPPREELGE
jgi:hypothetical protein